MLTIDEAFAKFNSRQELTEAEQKSVSRRHTEVRDVVSGGLKIERDFLTGSYKRWTKTKPLRDVDVFCVLHEDERGYRRKHPRIILQRVEEILLPRYGRDHVSIDGMAVTVDFGVAVNEDEDTAGQVMSIDVVPAFTKNGYYEIPDANDGDWIETNPEVHAQLAIDAQADYQDKWKSLVRMIKKWNRHQGRPITPSFLLEVMALDLLVPPFSGGYPYELKSFFADAADRIHDDWPDPAGLGPNVSAGMTRLQKDAARTALEKAQDDVTRAIRLSQLGKNGEALRAWREIFGPMFPLS